VIITGDFNATPDEDGYKFLEANGYTSSFKKVHGREPEKTFPTGIIAPKMDIDVAGTFDYIWFKGKDLEVQNVEIFGNKCLPEDKTIYPSDHYGLKANFEF